MTKLDALLALIRNWDAPDEERTDAITDRLPRAVEDAPALASHAVTTLRTFVAGESRFDEATDDQQFEYWMLRNIGSAIGKFGERHFDELLSDHRSADEPARFMAAYALKSLVSRGALDDDQKRRLLAAYLEDLAAWTTELGAHGEALRDVLDIHLPAIQQLTFAIEDRSALVPALVGATNAARTRKDDWWSEQFLYIAEIILGDIKPGAAPGAS